MIGEKAHQMLRIVLLDAEGKILQSNDTWIAPPEGLASPRVFRRVEHTIQFLLHGYNESESATRVIKENGVWVKTGRVFPKR